jgi:RecA/RadA recombinase
MRLEEMTILLVIDPDTRQQSEHSFPATDQQLKDYRKSFLLHPVDSLAERIRGEGYHTRIESYREAAIRLYNQDAHTTAEYAKEVMLHAVTKHELKQAQDWMIENS